MAIIIEKKENIMLNEKTLQPAQYAQVRDLLSASYLSAALREKILQSPTSCQNIFEAVEAGRREKHLGKERVKELLNYLRNRPSLNFSSPPGKFVLFAIPLRFYCKQVPLEPQKPIQTLENNQRIYP